MALIAEFMCLKILQAGLRMFMYEFFFPNSFMSLPSLFLSVLFLVHIRIKHAGF